jgi:murein DD-endopeptidase MepM/ murein hydrolase activator NlpD
MKNRIPNAITLLVIFTLLGCGCLILFNSSPVQAARRLPPTEPAPTPAGQGTEINQTDQIDAVAAAISEKMAQQVEAVPAFAIFQTIIEDLRLSDDALWAKALLVPSDPQTGKNLPSEPGLVIARWDGAAWEVVLPSDPEWPAYLRAAPTDLISDEHKAAWQEIYSSAESNQPTNVLRGYLLPWAGGITRNLSQSVSHDLYTPSGSAHYAFDFYTSGQMWDIYAARSGTVWMWQDSVPTCYQPTCNESQPLGNFLVLQDTTTSPTTYQLYLHLAQGSIQAGLKAVGTPVLQGQFLAKADNTGQSWGHHLHFMVHTNPASYWGNSVDISFDDVSINDGRPRTPAEASAYPQYGSQGSTAYTSQN